MDGQDYVGKKEKSLASSDLRSLLCDFFLPNPAITSLGFIFIGLILRLVLRSYAQGFRLSRIV
ncbi:MAG: hypothetical protein QOG92_1795 [Verrucomicrobiota bacterium]|nr:hypothetical protein [Verrucomicrobiota bacterium]